uniref:acyl-CoA thioester hydrolase/BAAT C-terminal domain-containing protein n=2 Tax=Flavobacterium sp. TaxID=239 RepID=UPI00404B6967
MNKSKNKLLIFGAILLLIGLYFIADYFLFDGFKPREIKENGFVAQFYTKENDHQKTTLVLIGGGQWGDYWGAEMVKNDLVGFSIPYASYEELPQLPEEIDLAYFEKALQWLHKQKEVNPSKVILMGASRNAELALILAATFPELVHGVIAYAPSSVSWANRVLPYNSNDLKPSWVYNGNDIPYVSMEKIKAPESDTIETLSYWKSGLDNQSEVQNAMIKVENINGPILLFSGKDDQVWPAAEMANMIENRILNSNFTFKFENIQFANVGHLIASNPEVVNESNVGTMTINNKVFTYKYGGTPTADAKAKKEAKQKVIAFLKE